MTPTTGDHDLDKQLGGEPSEVAELLDSEDADTQGRALRELTARGKRAVPALLDVLKSDSERARALAAEGLASIADPSTADALAKALNDSDGNVRAQAARALANLDDPRALDALLKTLGDAPDLLHAEYTLSAYTLANYGPRALPAIAPLLKSPDELTRARAIFILRRIADHMGANDKDLQRALKSYDPYGKKPDRDEAADVIAAWATGSHPEKEHKAVTSDVDDNSSKVDPSNY